MSERRGYEKTSHNQNFTDFASANGEIKNGEWIDLLESNFTLRDLKDAVAAKWDLDDDIADRIVIRFRVPGNKEGEHKNEYFDSDNQVLPSKDRVRTGGMTLMVRYLPLKEDESGNKTGDERDVDISCDSDYMLRVMPRVGEAIRAAYH